MLKRIDKGKEVSQKPDDARQARRLKALAAIMPAEEEDAAITAAALADPDNPPLTGPQLARFKPARRGRGRPAQAITKVPVSLRLDFVLLESFKATGDGWQTRMNEVLREWAVKHKVMLRHYHATVQKTENEQLTVYECMVLAQDDGAAKEKVKRHLRAEGRDNDARGQVYTVDMGSGMVDGLPLVC
nr:BrnA antitoxin family protein [Massilia sp. BJB1822]